MSDTEWRMIGDEGDSIDAEIVEFNNDEKTLILKWETEDYEKVTWVLSEDNLTFDFYNSETTLEAAKNDTTTMTVEFQLTRL